ncbi:hypothetical protein BpHYR1_019728 [Brachionus plicatilis]|uniref:Uncharacterized protein n=1 Tax=Brachionus plicatilis TaxID=10195 RepID=A0A3M7PYZ7_BRAPC|nr:hypothetical protein BpHYR1_019728 [Brachionus plicatilis]
MCPSDEPPPVASRLFCQGHQAMALTAAVCSLNTCKGCDVSIDAKLSLPPDAKCLPLLLHFNPHTSCSCIFKVPTWCCATLTSW